MKDYINDSKTLLTNIKDIMESDEGWVGKQAQIKVDKITALKPNIERAIGMCEEIHINMETPHKEADLYRLVKTQTLIEAGFSKAEIEDQPVVFMAITETDLRNHVKENYKEHIHGFMLDDIYDNMPKYHDLIASKFDTQSLNEQAFDIFSDVISDINPYGWEE
ncbi:MAG: hypothetical protein ACRC92_23935 [Peptostreptococcaceae bacterium]